MGPPSRSSVPLWARRDAAMTTGGRAPVKITSRFAPSPTGRLHLGHAWSALNAHDFARARGGLFLLRIEDLDPGRARAEHVAGIEEDLAWLGLDWDGSVLRQSTRAQAYADALDRLREQGVTYPCFCTRADIAAATDAPHGPAGPVYPGTCRPARDWMRAKTQPHAVRLDVTLALARAGPLSFQDMGLEVAADPARAGDAVLGRKDAPAAYHLAVVVDDAAQGVTDIVRGIDLKEATHVQRLLQALLDLPTPDYHHHALIVDAEGRRLAKRHGAPTLADMRAAGVDGRTLADALRGGRLPPGFRLAES